jgi:type I restriction enzyme M protein
MSLSSSIWSVADLLRGDYKQSDYGKVILPFTVLRRLDCVLEPTKQAVLAENNARTKAKVNPEYAAGRRGSNAPQGHHCLDLPPK